MSKNSRLAKAEAKAAKAQAKALRPPMYRRKSFWIISAVVVVIVIAGTSNNEDTSEGTSADVAVTTTSTDILDPRVEYLKALVSERYADCFQDLGGESDVAYSASKEGNREGIVVVTINDGRALRFDVGTFAGGGDATVPSDAATVDILDSVDC